MSQCKYLYKFSTISNTYSFVVVDTSLSQGWCYLFRCNQGQLSTSKDSFWGVKILICIGLTYCLVESLHFWECFQHAFGSSRLQANWHSDLFDISLLSSYTCVYVWMTGKWQILLTYFTLKITRRKMVIHYTEMMWYILTFKLTF